MLYFWKTISYVYHSIIVIRIAQQKNCPKDNEPKNSA
jgi:hypothetical protein